MKILAAAQLPRVSVRPGRLGLTTLVSGVVLGLWAAPALASGQPQSSEANTCTSELGQGDACQSDSDCAGNSFATVCVDLGSSDTCQAPCRNASGTGPDPTACSLGETCVPGLPVLATDPPLYYCRPDRFRVDLNLLDMCIAHFLEHTKPVFGSNACSLESNLNKLLDQTGEGRFDVFDVDLCVLAFVEQRGCVKDVNGDLHPEDEGVTCCEDDGVCGAGSYCDDVRHICQRDCGLVASREATFDTLDRECSQPLTVCDYTRGKCEEIDPADQTCQVDQDCPPGAYCLLGTCAENCYRAIDCPDSGWYCTKTNKCRALPPPDADEGFVFEPENYAIRFARDQLNVDDIQDYDASDLAIMDLITKRQVVGNASIAFGYRMEVSYGLKKDAACTKPFVDCSDPTQLTGGETELECTARQADCLISIDEEWLQLVSPFGTVTAAQVPTLEVKLDKAIADSLSPGVYPATVRLIFDNGDSDTIRVEYTKTSPSGEYTGGLRVYMGIEENSLNGSRELVFEMNLKVYPDQVRVWNELMQAHELDSDDEGFVDLSEGQLVHGVMDGSSAMAFTRGGVTNNVPDEIHFVGIYRPEAGVIRLVGQIDIPKLFQIDADGGSCTDGESLCVNNLFHRDIRRRIELNGSFAPATGKYVGFYRETIFGLVPDDGVTLEGTFALQQTIEDDSDLPIQSPLGDSSVVQFPVVTASDIDTATLCASTLVSEANDTAAATAALLQAQSDFESYIFQAARGGSGAPDNPFGRTTIFPDLVEFRAAIELALSSLDSNDFATTTSDPLDAEASAGQISQAHLNIYDFLEDWIVPCELDDPDPPPGCIDEEKLRCGLAIHQKAILEGSIRFSAVEAPGGHPPGVEPDVFCRDTLPTAGCPTHAAGVDANGTPFDYTDLFAMQEHNRFWLNLAQTLKYQGDRARSEAFMVLFRNEVDPFVQGTALSFKADQLRAAIRSYDRVIELMVDPENAQTLFAWPARSFKQIGNDWLAIMATVSSDRMDAVVELVDLERRVFATTDANDFRFAHHLLQQEYLIQVYLMVLQSRWQKDLFAYRGEAGPILERGQTVLSKLNPVKNELGITGGQVFFENSNPDIHNWEAYHEVLVGEDGDGGMLGDSRDTVLEAVEQLQNSLADLDSFEEKLQESRLGFADKLLEICGNPVPGGGAFFKSDGSLDGDAYCADLMNKFDDQDDWIKLRDCKLGGDDLAFGTDDAADQTKNQGTSDDGTTTTLHATKGFCPAGTRYQCATNCPGCDLANCRTLVKSFITGTDDIEPVLNDGDTDEAANSNTDDIINNPPRCGFEGLDLTVEVMGVDRPCVGGEMMSTFLEKEGIDRSRRIVIGSVETLIKEVQANLVLFKAQEDVANGKHLSETIFTLVDDALGFVLSILEEAAKPALEKVAEAPDCNIIGGLAVGTDCPQNGISVAIGALTDSSIGFAQTLLKEIKWGLERIQQQVQWSFDMKQLRADQAAALASQIRAIDSLIDEYNGLTQQSFATFVKIQNLRSGAQLAADRFGEEVLFVAEHLVGRESGNLLKGESMARDASASFEDILNYTYRMTKAFAHHYNLPPGDSSTLTAQALALVTLDDVAGFVAKLDKKVLEYCGLEGIDCDVENNVEVLRFSIRDQVFPGLRNVVDARSGKTLTAGEQFHNTITSPPYLKRRFRGTEVVDQIEIPITVPLTAKENTPVGPMWLVDPLTCNHMLDARKPNDTSGIDLGTHAVNVITNGNVDAASTAVRYELIRGPTDYIRGCRSQATQTEIGTTPIDQYPIQTWTIGYAPQNANALQDSPPAYVTRSASFQACTDFDEVGGNLEAAPCWRYFARDRSLSSYDWKLVIPMVIGDAVTENHWISGDGLAEDERPLIEDIVVYFRYRTRPIVEF